MELVRRWIDAGFDPETTEPDTLRRVRTISIATSAMTLIAAPFVPVLWALGSPAMGLALLALMAACGANLMALRRWRRLEICGHVGVGCFFTYLAVSNAVWGGFYDPGFAFLYVIPLTAALLVNVRAGWIWSGLCAACAAGFWLLAEMGVEAWYEIPADNLRRIHLASRIAAFLAVGVIASSFAGAQRQLELALRRTNRRIEELAFYDPLTGLANRRLFHARLSQALELADRHGRRLALLFVDLDGFKDINDSLGHDAGDRLLAAVAARLTQALRTSDVVARPECDSEAAVSRLGGDEFTILLSEVHDASGAAVAARRVLGALREPIRLDDRPLFVSASIGIALFPEDGVEADGLLRSADLAMYHAKERGRNHFQFFTELLSDEGRRRLELEGRLRAALEAGTDLSLAYQPLRNLVSGRLIGAEALLRWTDPELGPVGPDEFIPVAEQCGLIVPLGAWVFETACRQWQVWNAAGYVLPRLAVNVSGHQIRHPDFIPQVRRVLKETGVPPSRLELEITESTIVRDDRITHGALAALHATGVGLALDDFGTGYSSLTSLRRYPIDRLKIDRSFVAELPDNRDDAAIASAIIAMAHRLRMGVVGEGVETEEQLAFLRELGCDEVQGYLLSRPLAPGVFLGFLEQEKELAAAASVQLRDA